MIANKDPRVTVLMSVYNNEKYLKQAIDSILSQTFTDFEFLIINDGSTDNSENIIRSYSDPRIKLINNDVNLNLANSLNKGLLLAKGEYVVRMDADDISLPNRLERQVKYMDENVDIVLSGSFVKIIGSNVEWKYPLIPEECVSNLLFNSVLAHPSVIIRSKFFIDNNLFYNPNFVRCQDYELWTRVSLVGKIGNISKSLVHYRLKGDAQKNSDSKKQLFSMVIRKNFLNKLGVNFTEQEYNLHQKISLNEKLSIVELIKAIQWFNKLKNIKIDNLFSQKNFRHYLIKKKWSILSPIGLIKNFLK